MEDFSELSDAELVQEVEKRTKRITTIVDDFEICQKQINKLRERGKLLNEELDLIQEQYKEIIQEAKKRNIKIG